MAIQDSSNLNPIEFAKDWSYFTIVGSRSPGAIPRNGIHGFDRETGWDKKKGKGTAGATLTLTDFPPAIGSIALQLWEPQHFSEWAVFRALLKYTPGKRPGSATAADALAIYHPSLAGLGIISVVTHKVSPERHMGNGLYIVTIDFIEWLKSTNASVVATAAQSKTTGDPTKPGDKPDPWLTRHQRNAQAMADAARTPVGF